MNLWPAALVALGLALGLALGTTPLVRRFAVRFGFGDRPNPRRLQLKSRLGGLAIFVAFVVAVAGSSPLVEGRTAVEAQKIWGVLLGAVVAVVVGALDDRVELGAGPQLLAQVAAAAIALGAGVVASPITNPFGTETANSLLELPDWLAVVFTLFWVVGAMNTVNFIDGLDGLAAGIGGIASAVLFGHCLQMGQYSVSVLPLALVGALGGFLPYNIAPARITLGTSGAGFVGFALGTLSILGGTKAATVLLVLGVPIVDTGFIIARRLLLRQSPFSGDRTHLHHQLMAMGLSTNRIVLLYCGFAAVFGALALLLSSRLAKLYVFIGLAVLLTGILAVIAQRSFTK